MVPLQSLSTQIADWLGLVATLLAPGVVATVLWTPFLVAKRVRSLFRTLPPTESLLPSYVLAGLCGSIPFVGGLLAVFASGASNDPQTGAQLSNSLIDVAVVGTIGYAVGLPVVAALGLPRAGLDWDPTDYGASTWLLLAVGGVWYALVFAVPLVLLGVVFALPT